MTLYAMFCVESIFCLLANYRFSVSTYLNALKEYSNIRAQISMSQDDYKIRTFLKSQDVYFIKRGRRKKQWIGAGWNEIALLLQTKAAAKEEIFKLRTSVASYLLPTPRPVEDTPLPHSKFNFVFRMFPILDNIPTSYFNLYRKGADEVSIWHFWQL